MDVRDRLLTAAYRHQINGPNIESGFEKFIVLTGYGISYGAFCDAVADCLRAGLVHDPVRLPEGALQCHWHLELTPIGVIQALSYLAQAPVYEEH